MSFIISHELQFACFALAALLSFSFASVIAASELVGHPVRFAVLRWICEQATFCGLGGRDWFLILMSLGVFGAVGIIVTLMGVSFPYSFYISFIAACLWVLYEQRG